MAYIPAEANSDVANENLREHCEKVIKGIKKERSLLRSRLVSLTWKQKKYEDLLKDMNQLKLDLDE